jgi:hypothetical protein
MGSLTTTHAWQLFVFASLSASTAELCTTPLDALKTRLQLLATAGGGRPSALRTLASIVEREGVAALYAGVGPAVARQASYGSLRIGLYEVFRARLGTSFRAKLAAGCASGAVSALVCCPFDVLKVRLQAGTATEWNPFRALAALAAREGASGLYRGVGPTAARAAVVAAAEIACYDELKTQAVARGAAPGAASTHLGASVAAGGIASLIASPIDVIKSRVQALSAAGGGGATTTRAVIAAALREGPSVFWRGVATDFMRRGPHCVISFSVLEALRTRFA